MAEYIDKQATIIEMMDNDVDHVQGVDGREIVQILEDIPAEDVVPVVRCEDCKYHSFDAEYGNYWCNLTSGSRKIERFDFCSYGERKKA